MTEFKELAEIKSIIEAHPDMYKYAEVYITILDGHIIELFSIIRNQKPEEQLKHSRELKELQKSGLKIVKECWDIETLFSNIQKKDGIELENSQGTLPFLGSDEEVRPQYRPCSLEMTKIPKTENPKFISSSFKEHHYISCFCQYGTNTNLSPMASSSLKDLWDKVVPCPDQSRYTYLRDIYQVGFDILVPIYLKIRSCGVNKDGKLEVTVESIGIKEDAEIRISDTVNDTNNTNDKNNELPKSVSILKGEPVSGENKGRSKFYKVSLKVPEKYKKLKVELFLTSDTPLVSLNIITNIKKEIEKFNHVFSKWAIWENELISFLKRHSLLIFSSFAVILLLGLVISIYFRWIQNYLAVAQTIGVIVNVGLVYVIFRTYIRDMKERDHETAEKTHKILTDLKHTYEKYKRLVKSGQMGSKSNDYIFPLMSFEFFANNYIPLDIRNFIIEEMPEILGEHRNLMKQLNEYVLGAVDTQIRNETKNEIDSIIKKCDDEISRLEREYRLEQDKPE